MLVRHNGNLRWEGVSLLAYKEEEGSSFKDITRQILFEGAGDIPCQLRYFEIAPGGHSTLEHHEHLHLVVIARGEGHVLIGGEIHGVRENDVVEIPSHAWHQFRATSDKPLGFYCIVNTERDRPVRPSEEDLKSLRRKPEIAAFIRS
jgi:mannose-6-phosphate isomerase-like protein (cupin superfamily)